MRSGGSGAVAVGESDGMSLSGCGGVRLSAASRERVADVLEAVSAQVPGSGLPGPGQMADLSAARTALSSAWKLVVGAVIASAPGESGAGSRPCVTRLTELLAEIKRAEEALTAELLRLRDTRFGRVRDALAQLRDCESTEVLVERAASAVCAVGFDRAIVSRIEDSAWIAESVWVDRDRKWADEILEAGRTNPQVLDRMLVETEMVRRKVGILVHDVQARPAVHRPIAEASKSRSYAAVPLISGGEVIGFVHCDCYYQRRNLDDFDRRLLTVFAEGFSQALGRTTLLDRLSTIRAGVNQVSSTLATAWDERVTLGTWATIPVGPVTAGCTVVAGQPPLPDRLPGGSGEGGTLTRREIEVLRLMAAGDTNGRIARRLVISEGTVKSHVKHILRKLGAANRAEAVSRWLGMEHGRANGRPGAAGGPYRREN